MRIVWTLVKVVLALTIGIPLAIIALALGLGVLGAMIGIAVAVLKLGILALCVYGVFKLITHLLSPRPRPSQPGVKELPTHDPYYEAARRELDHELGEVPRR